MKTFRLRHDVTYKGNRIPKGTVIRVRVTPNGEAAFIPEIKGTDGQRIVVR